ncbi:MAG: photosynthetic complex assembly protein PuhC [Henriciella sp.]
MTAHSHDIQIPKPLLFGLGLLVTSVTGFVGISSLTGIGVADLSNEIAQERIQVRFLDEANGGVGAYDPQTEEAIHVFGPGEGGFVRTALRSLSMDRQQKGVGPTPPFELQLSATNNVVLFDPTTGKSITLTAFGDANQNDFAQLFNAHPTREMP